MKRKIVAWIKKEVKSAKAKGIVLGLSGGLDSAVAAGLSCQAIGRGNVLALILPCNSIAEDLKDAKLVVKALKLKAKNIGLTKVYELFIKLLPPANILTKANLKPRLRMAALYYFANKLNYLVCGTSNKTEASIGYFTKFGDGGADILPLAGLLKYQVRDLARELNIPKKIISKAPSAGLWRGQTDEAELGLTYNELDDILMRLEKGLKQSAPLNKVNKVKRLILQSAHKRGNAAICRI
ncbi:MAG: NAD+ synthase [Candidatus Omnitrophota bacterium]